MQHVYRKAICVLHRKGNIFGNTAQVLPAELFELFAILSKQENAKTNLVLDISKDELTLLLKAYGLEKSYKNIKSSEEILGKDLYDETATDRLKRIEALTSTEVRLYKLGLGSQNANIGIIANPITNETEDKFNSIYTASMLKTNGIRVAKIRLDNLKDAVISLPQALKALANMINDNKCNYISDYIIEILPAIVKIKAIKDAITEYRKTLKMIQQSA